MRYVLAVKIQTCKGVRGHAPRENFSLAPLNMGTRVVSRDFFPVDTRVKFFFPNNSQSYSVQVLQLFIN